MLTVETAMWGQIPPLRQAGISTAKDPGFYLAECEHSLLGSHHTAFEHDEVIGYLTIMDKATQWVDALVRKVIVGRCIFLDQLAILDKVALTNLVNLKIPSTTEKAVLGTKSITLRC